MKNKYNNAFKYAGNKAFLIANLNEKIGNEQYDVYMESFLGSGSLFYNLKNKFNQYILNDLDYNIVLMHRALQVYSYEDYMKIVSDVKTKFGDVKHNKNSFYAFRDWFNETYLDLICKHDKTTNAGLYLLYLAGLVINSILRFGPNGMNQSFGNREYIIPEIMYNDMKNRLNYKNCGICNTSYNCLNIHDNSVMFFDPPYVNREISYNKKFDQNKFLTFLKNINGNHQLILYTDYENEKSDELLNFGFEKEVIRTMRSIAPSTNKLITGNEVLYWKKI